MKAHEYWSIGALITMIGTFYMVLCQDLVQVKMRNFFPF